MSLRASSETWLLVYICLLVTFQCCHGYEVVTSGNKGSFLSPGYPSAYPPETNITFTHHFNVSGPRQMQVTLLVDLYTSPTLSRCDDYIKFSTRYLCGVFRQRRYEDIEGSFTMEFHSGKTSGDHSGFNITFTLLTGSCQPFLTLPPWSKYTFLPLVDILTRTSLVLTVRACGGLNVALGSDTEHPLQSSWEIKFWDLRRQLWLAECSSNGKCADILRASYKDRHLDCCNFRHLWIQWRLSDSDIKIGLGSEVGQQVLLSRNVTRKLAVRAVYLGTDLDSNFTVQFDAYLPDSYCKSSSNCTLPPSCPPPPTTASITPTNDVTTALDDPITYASVTSTREKETVKTIQMPPQPAQTSYSAPMCSCRCIRRSGPLQDRNQDTKKQQQEKEKHVTDTIKRALTVDARNTSANVRRYISAPDGRASSRTIGVVSGILCGVPFVLVLLSDMAPVARVLHQRLLQRP